MALQIDVVPFNEMETTEQQLNYIAFKYFAANNFDNVDYSWTNDENDFRKEHYSEITERYKVMCDVLNGIIY
jgi:hypothetical protein